MISYQNFVGYFTHHQRQSVAFTPFLFLIIFTLLWCPLLPAQEKLLPVFHFNHLTIPGGNVTRCTVVRDQKGFIWIAAIGAIVRYDGYTYKSFQYKTGDTNSLSSNIISALHMDSRGYLWIGTNRTGLDLYDIENNRFVHFLKRQGDANFPKFQTITTIHEDRLGNIWVGSRRKEVLCIDFSATTEDKNIDSMISRLRFHSFESEGFGGPIYDIDNWDSTKVLVSSVGGLFTIDRKSGKVARLHLPLLRGIRLDSIPTTRLLWQNPEKLWIGTTTHGLFLFERSKRPLTSYHKYSYKGNKQIEKNIDDLTLDKDGRLWVAMETELHLFDPSEGLYKEYLFSSGDSLRSTRLYLTTDSTGTLWVGTMEEGIYFLSRKTLRFPHFALRGSDGKPRETETVNLWNDGTVWISTEGNVVNVNVSDLNVLQTVDLFRGDRSNYGHKGVANSYYDGKGNFWYGSYSLGIYKFTPGSRTVKNFRPSKQTPPLKRRGNCCLGLIPGENDTLWIASNESGLRKFDLNTGRYSEVQDTILSRLFNVWYLMKDSSGKIWISDGFNGLFIIDPSRKITEHFEHPLNGPKSLGNESWTTCQDRQGTIWMSSTRLLSSYDPVTGSFRNHPNEAIINPAVVEIFGYDQYGRIWTHYHPGVLGIFDPATDTFSNFDVSDGLFTDMYEMFQLPDHRMVITGRHGMNIVHPDSVFKPESAPPFVFTRLTVNDTLDISTHNLSEGSVFKLPFTQNVLEFEFAAINPGATHLTDYSYMLEGLENTWVKSVDRRYVRYSGLSPGDYTFRVKAINKYGRWPDQEISLAISIAPPWWRTWWAYTIYGVFFLGALVGGYRLRLRQIYLKQHADMEHFQAERLAEVDKLKSRFFANISHEFRTPLTLILGPANQMKESIKDPATLQKLNLIKNNANKLYGLVNQLLDFSKVESGAMKLHVSNGDIITFLRRIVMSFESWAERKKIDLEFTSDTDSVEGFFDADKLEKIVNNLLSNALKFTPDGASVSVSVSIDPTLTLPLVRGGNDISPLIRGRERGGQKGNRDGMVVISVSDTGSGIPAEHLPNIFNRFYRADDSHHVEGTGIGLALVWELTQLHHGSVTVDSTLGKGSTFTVKIPIDQGRYSAEEIVAIPSETENAVIVESSPVYASSIAENSTDGKPIVLVVEDNPDLRAYIREFLTADYAVNEAGNGKEGLERATEVIPDIVISDVMMPEMDGFELCRALKQDVRTSHVPVILLTARAGTDSKIEGLEIGADDYVTKPFDSKELLARVKNLIEQRKQLRQKFSAGVVLKPGEVAVTSLDDSLLKKVMDVVEKNLGDENFSVEELAREACLSQRHLARKLQALTNLKPSEFIQYVRLQRSRELLEKNAGSIADIAYKVGFGSPSYFSSCFRERFGYPPSEVPIQNRVM